MNCVSVELLELFNNNQGSIRLEDCMHILNISKRSLMYNIEKINYILIKNHLTCIYLEDSIVYFPNYDERTIELIHHEIHNSYNLSKQERKHLLILKCALSILKCNIDDLKEYLNVSRSTINNELAELKKEGIQIQYDQKKGFDLIGEEGEIRYLIMENAYALNSSLLKSMVNEFFEEQLEKILNLDLEAYYQTIKEAILESEGLIKGYYNYDSIEEIKRYISLIFLRNAKGKTIDNSEDKECESIAASYIVNKLNSCGIKIDEKEINYLNHVLYAVKLSGYDEEFSKINSKMCQDLIESLEFNGLISIKENPEVYKMLLIHLHSLIHRLKYHIKIDNPFVHEIQFKYHDVFMMVKGAIVKFEEKYGLSIPDDEIAYLGIYIGGMLCWNKKHISNGYRILLVCGTGMGTAYLLKQQLISLIGNQYEYETKDYREVDEKDLDYYDLILSTIQLSCIDEKVLLVNSLLNKSQKREILNWSLSLHHSQCHESNLTSILKIIEKYTVINDKEDMIKELKLQMLHQSNEIKELHLKDVMKKQYVMKVEDELDCNQGLYLSSLPLIEDGVMDIHYYLEIVKTIEQLGLYMEYVPGVLLAHSKATENVTRVGISCTIFEHPILFEKYDRRIKVIITLATPNRKDHLKALDELFKIIIKEDFLKMVDSDIEKVYQLFELYK